MFDALLVIPAMILLIVAAFVVAYKDDSPRAIGLVALPVSWLSVAYGSVPFVVTFALCFTVFVLFLVAMLRPEDRDDKWHYAALLVAGLGRLVVWVMPNIGNILTGNAPIWVFLLVVGVPIAIGFAWQQGLFKDRFRRKSATTPSS